MKAENTVKIGGQDYTLVFDFKAVVRFEEEADASIFHLVSGDLTMRQLGAAFWAVLQDRHQVERDAVPGLIDEAGVPAVLGWVSEGLGKILTTQPKKASKTN